MTAPSVLLRARLVHPVSGPPIENGAVFVSGGIIQAAGRWCDVQQSAERTIDLGESVLLPGLINAHCHLDYTHMAGHLPPPADFPDWIKGILAFKANWSYADYAASWIDGARMLIDTGTTTVLDVEAVPELIPEVWNATPLRVISALEMTGLRSGRPPVDLVEEAVQLARRHRHPRCSIALSPHALYSTRPELPTLAAGAAEREKLPFTIHVAESRAEWEMFTEARGALYDWLQPQRDMADCGHQTPVARLAELNALGPRSLLVHVNHLGDDDARLIAGSGASVVHCPRSHDYFRHQPFPCDELFKAGVNVCLGTDSLASARSNAKDHPRLDLVHELQRFVDARPERAPEAGLRLVTINAARALNRTGELGEITPGARADLVAFPSFGPTHEALDEWLHQRGSASFSMIDGEVVLHTGR